MNLPADEFAGRKQKTRGCPGALGWSWVVETQQSGASSASIRSLLHRLRLRGPLQLWVFLALQMLK